MDFESEKKVSLVTMIEILAVCIFLFFIMYQIFNYMEVRDGKDPVKKEAVKTQIEKQEAAEQSLTEDIKPANYLYEGEHPYASVDLPFSLVSLTIESSEGSAVYTNGKDAGVNLPVDPIMDPSSGVITAVDLSGLGNEMLSFSGTGSDPAFVIRFDEGYAIKASVGHAFQTSVNKDGDLKIYNINKGDDISISFSSNYDSYKYPGTAKFTLSLTAIENGAISMQLRGSILTLSGLPFEKAMLSVDEGVTGGGYGVPAESESGFYTYNFNTRESSSTDSKGGQ